MKVKIIIRVVCSVVVNSNYFIFVDYYRRIVEHHTEA